MLTDMNNVPSNSQTPLPADFFTRGQQDLYNLFSAGLTAKAASTCIAPPQTFVDLSPAGNPLAQVTRNVGSPALSQAYVGPAPAPPLASQVAQVQARLNQMLVGNTSNLAAAVSQAGGQGATTGGAPDAAVVLPMGQTENTVAEKHPHFRKKRMQRSTESPGPPWGGAAVLVPQGGCRQGLSGWAKLFLVAGAAIIAVAVVDR
jgi:hypothetical protein